MSTHVPPSPPGGLPVLDRGFVELEEYMGGDAAVVRAARICYASEPRGAAADARLIYRLLRSEPQHNTPFEHAVFRWHVKAPLYVTRQWMRHRMGVFNEKSLRYCVADREYYVPERTPDTDRYLEWFRRGRRGPLPCHIPSWQVAYLRAKESEFEAYENLLDLGLPREQARGLLGTAVYTEFVWTVNAWSLMNWLTKRLDKGAQREHREYARAVQALWSRAMPITAAAYRESRPDARGDG